MEQDFADAKTYQKSYDWLKPHHFKKGNAGGPGRPKGPTLKTWVRNHFESMTEDERMEFLNKIDPIKAWEMGEGKPDTKTTVDATVEHKLDPESAKVIHKALDEII
jgi:hypothetical protein